MSPSLAGPNFHTLLDIPLISAHYWKDLEMFNLPRFLDNWPREVFMPFSQGAHACIGQKYVLESFNDRLLMSICRFFATEAIAVLTMIILKYKITIRE